MIEDRHAAALTSATWSAAIVLVLVGVVAAIARDGLTMVLVTYG